MYGESVVERPMVIEAYSTVSDPSDRLSISRHRAILVRQYLQLHFQLDGERLGVVSMKNASIQSQDDPPRDGVCIVVLNAALCYAL